MDNETLKSIKDKYEPLLPYLNEKIRRIWTACEALSLGWGGVTLLAHATGLSQATIKSGIRELSESSVTPSEKDLSVGTV